LCQSQILLEVTDVSEHKDHPSIDCCSFVGNRAHGRGQAPDASAAPSSSSTQAQSSAPQTAPAPAEAAAPSLKFPWKIGPMAVTAFVDGYYSYNYNQPTIGAKQPDKRPLQLQRQNRHGRVERGQAHAEPRSGSIRRALRLSLWPHQQPRECRPAGRLYRAGVSEPQTESGKGLSRPTSANSSPRLERKVIEAKDNWNYSRSLLFAWAIPYTHFGLRTSMPVSKTETVGVQVVDGWNVVTKNNGWATVGLTSAYVKTKYTWDLNFYTGPENALAGHGYRNLVDTTLAAHPKQQIQRLRQLRLRPKPGCRSRQWRVRQRRPQHQRLAGRRFRFSSAVQGYDGDCRPL